jgi:polysaccharide export outer membrane protein
MQSSAYPCSQKDFVEKNMPIFNPRRVLTVFGASVFFLSTSISASYANNSDVFAYVNQDEIAIDPVLLTTDDLEKFKNDFLSPQPTLKNKEGTSQLEQLYSERLREPLKQFGYDMFPANLNEPAGGAVQDDYILENGDNVNILVRGEVNINTTTSINNEGLLIIDTLPPIMAAGKSIKSVQDEIRLQLRDLYNTEIFLSLDKTRKISVTVSGDVGQPGQVTLSNFHTVIDAIGQAGGIKKTGSLRQIKVIRNNQSSLLDLYGVLMYGSATSDISLRDGDRIIVPPIGPTIAIAGAVKRPAIYEVMPASRSLHRDENSISQRLSLRDMLDISGGAIFPSATRYLRFTLENNDRDSIDEITNVYDRAFGDGDILYVRQNNHNNTTDKSGSIDVIGDSPLSGLYALAEIPSLSQLFKNRQNLGTQIYPLLGLIERWNDKRLSREYISFSPLQIIAGESDMSLEESDKIILFNRDDIKSLKADESIENFNLDSNSTSVNVADAQQSMSPNIRKILVEHGVFLRGSIRMAGIYPIAEKTNLDDLLSIAGGASLEANIKNVEITQPRADKSAQRTNINLVSTPASLITLNPGDTVRIAQNFKQIEDRHVILGGEVKNPGSYDLMAGDTLSTLIQRAGGLTDEAYPKGTIFSRKSERLREEQRYQSQARGLELSLASALQTSSDNNKPNDTEISLARNLIAELKGAEALGRITVEADPTILANNPELDILLESGDRVFIPKRPLTVRVAGEILSPAALQFRSGKTPRDYINEAGGFSYNADQDRAFVIFPDGSARPLQVSAWNHATTMIPPGSTIVVPRDPKPLTFMDGAKDLSQILANLATTAIFADDLADNRD